MSGWRWRHFALAVFVAAATGLIWWRASLMYQERMVNEQRAALQASADDIAALLTSDISRRQAQLVGLAASVKTHSVEDLREKHFEIFASGLRADDPATRAIQFFPPQGTVMIYPLEGNEAVAGSTLADLRANDRTNVRDDVERAIESGEITLSDPYELRQGGKGVVARLAVYDKGRFLGLVVIVLNLDPLLDIPSLNTFMDDSLLAMWDEEENVFFGDERVVSSSPVLAKVVLPGSAWMIGAVPREGWGGYARKQITAFTVIGLLVASLLGVVTYQVSSSQASLKKAVAERTAELAASEERYVTALKMVNQGIWDWDAETDSGFASGNSFTMLGYEDSSGTLSIPLLQAHMHPDDLERILTGIRERVKGSEGFDVEVRMQTVGGAWFDAMISGKVVERYADGKGKRLAGTITDITEKKRAEAAMREGQSKFYALFDNNHAPMLLLMPEDGEIVDANPAACAFYGWNREEMIGKLISEINILSPEEVHEEMSHAIREERRYFQFRHQLANGEIRDVEVFSGPIEHAGKTHLYSIIHDITFRKQAERALEESEERYRQLLTMTPVGITVYSMGAIQYINLAGARLLGATSVEEVIGKDMDAIMPPERLSETRQRMASYMDRLGDKYQVDTVFKRLDGSLVSVHLIVSSMIYQGKPALQGVFSDISERMKSEEKIRAAQEELQRLLAEADRSRLVLLSVIEDQKIAEEKLNQLNMELEQRVADRTAQLQAANRELEAFSYSVSHDLRSPLRGIDGWSQALLEDCGSQLDEKGQQYIARVRSETQRMGELIDDLLRLSRVTRVEMSRASVPLSEIARRVAASLQEEAPQRQVEFIIQPNVGALGDTNLLEIALTNLLSNAFKFTGKTPQARIEFGQQVCDGEEVYYVRDNGAGFDMNFARNLFGAFQRMHKQNEFPGNGVGLATVQRIIHRHGGRVWAEAQKNQGATFYFTLHEER